MSFNPISQENQLTSLGAANSDTSAAQETLPGRIISRSLMEIDPTTSVTSLAGRVQHLPIAASSFSGAPTQEEEELIIAATGLKARIKYRKNPGELRFSIDYQDLNDQLNFFLGKLQAVKDPEKTLDVILPNIQAEDKWIIYKNLNRSLYSYVLYLDLAFKKIVQNLHPDLSKIENLRPIFEHPIDPQEWRQLFPILQSFASSVGEAHASAGSEVPSDAVQIVILTALAQAVKSDNPEATSFLLANFPFLKSPMITQNKNFSIDFTDSQQIDHYNTFDNAFYLALISGNFECIKAFLASGWDLKGEAGAKIIKIFLLEREEYDSPNAKIFTQQELINNRCIFKLLVERGLDPDLIIEGTSGIPCTMGETLFLHHNPELKMYGLYLFEFENARLEPHIVEKMKVDLLEFTEYRDVIIRVLSKRGKDPADEILCVMDLPPHLERRDFLMRKISYAKVIINKLLRRYTGNPLIENFKELEEIRELKKEVKKHLAANAEDASLRAAYTSFSSEYDALVTNHYLLSELRQVSQELRSYINTITRPAESAARLGAAAPATPSLSNRVVALFNLWNPRAGRESKQARELIRTLDTTTRLANFQIVRRNFLKYVAQMNADPFWRDKYVTCLHGTKLAPDMLNEGALIPAGMLGDDPRGALVQFSGEQYGSYKAHNKDYISCVTPANDWADLETTNRLLGVPTPMLVSEIYACQFFGMGEVETCFDYHGSRNRANWEYIAKSVFLASEISLKNLQQCQTDILRLRAWDSSHQEYLTPILEQVRKLSEDRTTPEFYRVALEELERALTINIKFPLTKLDRDLLSHPIPIMFASTTSSPIPLREVRPLATHVDEVFMKGRVNFGPDLQAAFVTQQDVPRATMHLEQRGIKIFPFEMAHAIETVRMMCRSDLKKTVLSLASDQEKLGAILQQEILPYYGRPLAEKPSYIDAAGVYCLVDRPFWGREFPSYAAYKHAVEETTAIARSIHGKMHAIRTSIAAQLWGNVYSAMKGETVAPNRNLLTIAAAAHDAQRQDEGVDHWDRASGSALHSYLASRGYPKEICSLYAHALIEKDPTEKDAGEKPIYTSDVQRIIHDADTLEIIRVLRNRTNFRIEELAALEFWKNSKEHAIAKVPADNELALREAQERFLEIQTDLQKIVLEWEIFIDKTEQPWLKMLLEYTPSIDYYTEVIKILKYVTNQGSLPTLKKWLAGELAQVPDEPSVNVKEFL